MVYRICKQYDHVIMLSKNQSAHSPGIHLIHVCASGCKFINHGIKPSGQQQIQHWLCWHNPPIFSVILVLLQPTSVYSEIHFSFEIHSKIAEIHVSGIINQQN